MRVITSSSSGLPPGAMRRDATLRELPLSAMVRVPAEGPPNWLPPLAMGTAASRKEVFSEDPALPARVSFWVATWDTTRGLTAGEGLAGGLCPTDRRVIPAPFAVPPLPPRAVRRVVAP